MQIKNKNINLCGKVKVEEDVLKFFCWWHKKEVLYKQKVFNQILNILPKRYIASNM